MLSRLAGFAAKLSQACRAGNQSVTGHNVRAYLCKIRDFCKAMSNIGQSGTILS
jgi:hypothetical protein